MHIQDRALTYTIRIEWLYGRYTWWLSYSPFRGVTEIEDLHMPVDMLVLPMSDFDVVLGMDWLNRYRVVIDCHETTLSFKIRGIEVECKLEKPRPPSMHTKELWEKPMIRSSLSGWQRNNYGNGSSGAAVYRCVPS